MTRLLQKDNSRAAPDEKTTALYSSLRAEARRRASLPPRPASEADPVPDVAGYIPHALTGLIGREKECEAVVERLAESGETDTVRDRHLSWCVALAENAVPGMMGPEQAALLACLETEHDNLRAGLAWGEASPAGAEQTLRLAGALGTFWFLRGHWAEEQRHLTAALAREGAASSTVAWARALLSLSRLAHFQSDFETMRSLAEQLLVVSREIGYYTGEVESLTNMGFAKLGQGNLEAAASYYTQSLVIALKHKHRVTESRYNGLGSIKRQQGDLEATYSYYEQALAIRREIGWRDGVAYSYEFLANAKLAQGDLSAARSLHEQALAIRREMGDPMGEAKSLHSLADLARTQEDWKAAVPLYEQARAIHHRLGDRKGEGGDLFCLASLACSLGDWEKSRLLGKEALTISRETGDIENETLCLNRLAEAARTQGAPVEARALLAQSLTLHQKFDNPQITLNTLVERAALALAESDAPGAARLLGAVQAAQEAGAAGLLPEQRGTHKQTLSAARAALSEDAFTEAWDAGRGMTLDAAVRYTLEEVRAMKAFCATGLYEWRGAAVKVPRRNRQTGR